MKNFIKSPKSYEYLKGIIIGIIFGMILDAINVFGNFLLYFLSNHK